MPESEKTQYFSKHPTSKLKVHKLFEPIRTHTLTLQTSSGIFSPDKVDKGTRILIENLAIPDTYLGMNILDLGAGYGPICIWLAKEFKLKNQLNPKTSFIPNIFASEINDRAIWLLNRNIVTNKCDNISILKGDFRDHYDLLKEKGVKFQAVYTNPPLKTGHSVMLDLFDQAMDLLTPTGFIQYIQMKKLGAPGFLKKLKNLRPGEDWFFTVVKKKGGFHVIIASRIEFKMETVNSGYF